MRKILRKCILLLLMASLSIPQVIAGVANKDYKEGVIYVSPKGSSDGTSWENATDNLNEALKIAEKQSLDVYVSSGTFSGNKDSLSAFVIPEGVNVYGGFAGTESSPKERNLNKNKTILSGQNLQRVLYQPKDFTDTTFSIWDGFVIEKGTFKEDDEYRGAGVYMRDYSALVNCEIRNNSSSYDDYNYGLGVYVDEARHSILENCLIHHNTTAKDENDEYVTVYGSGIYCYYGSNIINCTIADNVSSSGDYAVDLSGSHNEMYNTIVYGNKNINYLGEPRETKSITIGGSSNVHHCAIECVIEHGNNNYNVQSSDFNEDYSLKQGSVCLDMSTTYEALSTIDLKGNKRVQG
ncbi:MAG: right-handed parallel beta-helix repeat-containing protein, partial [Paludibacteraceae bacterium]|nr:right-handed parallel beta-helix repeat-containing protein [Paludibacteraceae bacterium]